jgi:hypothetical protein
MTNLPWLSTRTSTNIKVAKYPPLCEVVHVNQQLPFRDIIRLEPAVVQKPIIIEPAPVEIPAVPMAIIDEEDDDLIEYIDEDSTDNESRIGDSESSEDRHSPMKEQDQQMQVYINQEYGLPDPQKSPAAHLIAAKLTKVMVNERRHLTPESPNEVKINGGIRPFISQRFHSFQAW